MDRAGMKYQARQQLSQNWRDAIIFSLLIFLMYTAVAVVGSVPVIGQIIAMVASAPLYIGIKKAYLNYVKENEILDARVALEPYQDFKRNFMVMLMMYVYTILWGLLFIIPGIIKGIAYYLAPYLAAEYKHLDHNEAIRLSMRITQGHKMEMFVMFLSFFGWAILAAFTLGLGYLVLWPYMETTFTHMYLNLKDEAIRNGVISQSELEYHQPPVTPVL